MKVFVRFPNGNILDYKSGFAIDSNTTFENSVLYLWDIIDEQSLDELIEKYGMPTYIVNDSYSFLSYKNYRIFCANKWLEWQLGEFEKNKIIKPTDIVTENCVNFCINKKQINRHLTIKLCEIFDLDCAYTWSGIGEYFDLSKIIEEKTNLNDQLVDEHWGELLSLIKKFKKSWIQWDGIDDFGLSSIVNYGSNIETWNRGLNNIFSKSAVSLISESVTADNAIHFSEKTAYAILGLTFPIWIGGKNQAAEWKKYGFDTFDDIIDHNYQTMNTLLERCFYAVYLNLDLLEDKKKLKHLRTKNLERLIENRNLLTYCNFKNYNARLVRNWPTDLQHAIAPVFKKYIIE